MLAIAQLPLWQVLVLAVVQGLTEFLPVSSSGHLVVLAAWMSSGEGANLDVSDLNVVLHVGTLGSVVAFYGYRIVHMFRRDHRMLGLLALGSVPTVLLGVPLKVFLEPVFSSATVTGLLLIATGLILLWGGRAVRGGTVERELREGQESGEHPQAEERQRSSESVLGVRQALLIGAAQAVAVLPGLSRSGATISVGLRLGLAPRSAATFSFLLAIPAIAGAGLWEAVALVSTGEMQTSPGALVLGLLVSFSVGWVALSWLVNWLERGRLSFFAWWCIPLGLLVLADPWW